MTRPFRITTGKSRLSQRIQRKKVKWESLAKRLTEYGQIDCTYDEYMAMAPDEQAALKDQGWFIGGQFNGPKRLLQDMARRCCITLDVDHADPWDIDEVADTYADYAFAIHSTAKHSKDSPRLRLVLPLDKDIHPEKYEPVARRIASWLGMDIFDDTTFQPARIMYWPTVTIDGDVYTRVNEGKFINAQEILDTYDDWQDFGEWPHSNRVERLRKPVQAAEDPLTKPGVVGAFCRTFDIHSAIQTFELPYEPTEFENRYRPEGSSGAAGAIVYDDVFLYSHHESDVAAQLNLNAFDLVRLHRFSELAARESDDMSMGDRPSYRAMCQLAVSSPEVVKELHTSPDEMEAVEEPVKPNGEDHEPAEHMLTFAELRREMLTIKDLDDPEPACDMMVPKIAAAKLTKSDNSRLAGLLRDLYPDPKPTKKAIEDDIKEAGKRLIGHLATEGTIVDAERRVIQYAFDEHFEGGATLKRFAKTYWTYQGGLWAIDGDERIDGLLAHTIIELREQRPIELAELVATVDDRNTSAWLASLAKVIKGLLAARESRDDPLRLMRTYPLPVVNTKNCELWFNAEGEMEVRDHNPDNFFTIRIECDYKPKAKCPEWDRFCEIIFSETADPEDMQRHLEELGGYILGTSRWLKTWVLLHGPKDTGKSTFTEVLRRLLGDSFFGESLTEFSHGESQFKNTRLIGKLVFVDDDYDAGAKLPDGFLKKISEEKTLSTDRKYGEGFSFVCRALPIICSNHWPHASDITDALRERALVFPFNHKIAGSERDDTRRAAMMDELPGILNRFIAGLSRLRERGDWDIPIDCGEAHDIFEAELNIVSKWKQECVVQDRDSYIEPAAAYQSFEDWLLAQHIPKRERHVPGRNGFYKKLDGLLGERRQGHAGKLSWRGWKIVTSRVDEMDDAADDYDDWDQ